MAEGVELSQKGGALLFWISIIEQWDKTPSKARSLTARHNIVRRRLKMDELFEQI